MSRKLKVYSVNRNYVLLDPTGEIGSLLEPIERRGQSNGEIYVWAPTKAQAIEYLISSGIGTYASREITVGMGNHLATIVDSGIAGTDGDILVQRGSQDGRHVVRLRRDDSSDPTHVATWRYDRELGSPTRWQLVLDVLI